MAVNKILTLSDLSEIENFFSKNGYCGIEVVIKVETQEMLNKINEQFYYTNNQEGSPEYAPVVNVNIGNTLFKYIVDESVAEE